MSTENKKNVIIIGERLVGLASANILKHQGVSFKIFERGSCIKDRTQSWSHSTYFYLFMLKSLMGTAKYAILGQKISC